DGLSIAWAVAEHIAAKIGCKTLFATHYHELTELSEKAEGIKNCCIKVQENPDGVLFLRKIVPGSADKSYGIEVAKLAGFPQEVVRRAENLLTVLEEKEHRLGKTGRVVQEEASVNERVNLFNYKAKTLLDQLKDLPVDEMTPIEALNYLNEIKKKAKES
ncbi:MAG TPA: DNA mismatch repair protein MutS, partial [Eubacteriaceae bacterium]|nr:DNA mismatch repair protein MutS [Eubacteriaceae bacterium]